MNWFVFSMFNWNQKSVQVEVLARSESVVWQQLMLLVKNCQLVKQRILGVLKTSRLYHIDTGCRKTSRLYHIDIGCRKTSRLYQPYRYRLQKKSWMDSVLFEGYVRELNAEFKAKEGKCALITVLHIMRISY